MTIQRSMTPVLTECCGEVCQTARLSGTWRWETFEQYEMGRTQDLGLVFNNGESFIFNYTYLIDHITDVGVLHHDHLGGSFEGGFSGPGFWHVGISRASDSYYSPPPPPPPANGSIYELAVSWCPECTNGVTCAVKFNGFLYQSFTIQDACTPRHDYECVVEMVCSPTPTVSDGTNTTVDCFATVTDLGGGLYTVIVDDSNASGLWTDPLAFHTASLTTAWLYSGAGLMCHDCVVAEGFTFSPYRLWHVVDPNDGNAPYTLPIEVSDVGLGTTFGVNTGAIGLYAQIDYDFTLSDETCEELNALRDQARALLDTWIAQFGSGVPVLVRNASTHAVDCWGYRDELLAETTLDVAHVGILLNHFCETHSPPSNVTSFELECGSLPLSENIVEWYYDFPT